MKLIPKGATRALGRAILKSKKNSPHIFFAAGVAGGVGSTVLACRATLQLSEKVDALQDTVGEVKALGEAAIDDPKSAYSSKEYNKDLGYVYAMGTLEIVRLYLPAVVLGGASVMALTGSHVVLARRNAALTATVGMLSTAFEGYRQRVAAEFGKERELDIYHGVEEEPCLDEKGKEIGTVKVVDPNALSPYSRFFDEYSPNWEKNAEINRLFVQAQQQYFNHILNSRGHVFLNEIYDALGIERSQEGAVVGWIRDGEGDNYIDFGIFEVQNRDFVNGQERSILLDFNVDGVVYDKI